MSILYRFWNLNVFDYNSQTKHFLEKLHIAKLSHTSSSTTLVYYFQIKSLTNWVKYVFFPQVLLQIQNSGSNLSITLKQSTFRRNFIYQWAPRNAQQVWYTKFNLDPSGFQVTLSFCYNCIEFQTTSWSQTWSAVSNLWPFSFISDCTWTRNTFPDAYHFSHSFIVTWFLVH